MSKNNLRIKSKVLSLIPLVGISLIILIISNNLFPYINFLIPSSIRDVANDLVNNNIAYQSQIAIDFLKENPNKAIPLFLLLQLFQVIFTPIPGQIMGIAGGYIFGFGFGLFLTMLGLTIGSLAAMMIGRTFSKFVVRKFIKPKKLHKFDDLISRGGYYNFFIFFLLPLFPDDALCFVAGLTKLKIHKLMGVAILGRLPGMVVYSFIGDNLISNLKLSIWIFILAYGLSFIIWIYEDKIKNMYFNFISK